MIETPYHPAFEKLLRLALRRREEFAVLTPVERAIKKRAQVHAFIIQRLSKEDKPPKGKGKRKKPRRKKQHSIGFQHRINLGYVKEQGYKFDGEASDKDVSGKDFIDRTEYNRLKKGLATKRLKGPIVFIFLNPDRFARSVKEGIAELEDLEKMGILLEFSDDLYHHLNMGNPEIRRIRILEELVKAERERLIMIHRTKMGLDEARLEGIHLGHVPKYYQIDDEGRLKPSAKVKMVCRLRAEGDGWRSISRETGLSTGRCRAIVAFVADRASKVSG